MDHFQLVYVKFIPTRHILIIATLAINLINITSRKERTIINHAQIHNPLMEIQSSIPAAANTFLRKYPG